MNELKNKNKFFTFIDLFAGIGGFHLAVKEVIKDSKCVFVSEIDEKCIEVYQKNFN
jgi:DNA (cytosine-5)-methyltransferase 1